jgi:hypothetical protein
MSRYALVVGASRLRIEARSTVHPIEVEASDLTGSFDADVAEGEVVVRPGAHLEIEVRDLSSGNVLVDQEARRRLDPRRHPRITAELTAWGPVSPGVAACRGVVAYQGRTVPVEGELRVTEAAGGGLVLEGRQRVDVRDWGIRPPRLLLVKVHPVVTVVLELHGRIAGS